MHIAYVSLHWPRSTSSGIGKKIRRQISAWEALGHEVRFFMHMHEPENKNMLIEGKHFPFHMEKGARGFLRTEINRSHALENMLAGIREYQPDVIYLRWSMYVYPLQRLYMIAPVVVEINTNDVAEHKLLGLVQSSYNRVTRGITLKNASGIIYSSWELAHLNIFAKFNKPYRVISNSIDLNKISLMPAPANKNPHLVFIGTPGLAWHGIEKLVSLAQKFPDLIFDVVGYDHLEGFSSIPTNLILHGYLKDKAFDRILAQADVAIGTLALHKKGMQEACPLKIRDCIARGIPCILPYRDTDLDDLDSDMILHIPNQEDNVKNHAQEIHDFAYRMCGKRIPRELIAGRIDSLVKETQRLELFKEIHTS